MQISKSAAGFSLLLFGIILAKPTADVISSPLHGIFTKYVRQGSPIDLRKDLIGDDGVEIATNGGLALLHAICTDDTTTRTLLLEANAHILPGDEEAALDYVKNRIKSKAQWQSLLLKLVEYRQMNFLTHLAENKSNQVSAYGYPALEYAMKQEDAIFAQTILIIAGADHELDDLKTLNLIRRVVGQYIQWEAVLLLITKFGTSTLLMLVAKNMTIEVIAHGGLALLHAMCKDQNEARNILLNAGAHIRDLTFNVGKRETNNLSKHDMKEVIRTYITGDVNTPSEWRRFLVKIVMSRRIDILQEISRQNKDEVAAYGGAALWAAAYRMDSGIKTILLETNARADLDDHSAIVTYMTEDVLNDSEWEYLLTQLVLRKQTALLEAVTRNAETVKRVADCGGQALEFALKSKYDEAWRALVTTGAAVKLNVQDVFKQLKRTMPPADLKWPKTLYGILLQNQIRLLETIIKSVRLAKVVAAHGGIALYHTIIWDRDVPMRILLNAGANIHPNDIPIILNQVREGNYTPNG